jgi:hypothetical protein
MIRRRFALRLTGGLLACTLLVCVALRHRQIQTQLKQPFGHYTQQQIIDRTLPLCRTVLGQTDGLMLATERLHIDTADSRSHLWWHVECVNRANKPLAQFLWNAETGELAFTARNAGMSSASASPPARAYSDRTTPERAKGRAAWLSYRWLSWLGIGGGSGWRLMQEPERSARRSDVWYTRWRSSEHEASVKVDIGTRALVSAQSRPLSSPNLLRMQ